MLSDRARIILFWFTIGLMVLVAVLAAVTILRACGGLPTQQEPPPTISPDEVSLCSGEQQQFTVADDVEVAWEATGGRISEAGIFTAGDSPGDYTVTATGTDSGQAAAAIVHVVACTPTPTLPPSPTPFVTPTPSPTATSAPVSSPTPSSGAADPPGDVGAYETGAAVDGAPAGVDVRDASVDPDLSASLRPDNIPAELADWADEGEAVFWIALHEPIVDPPTVYMNWLFVLDVDGNQDTGRPVGSARINPDLGDEVAVGVSYNVATGAFEPYSLVWNTENGEWAAGPEVRYTIGESRTVMGLALPRDALEQEVSQVSGLTIAPDAMRGRAAAETYVGEQRVIDFYPNLPE